MTREQLVAQIRAKKSYLLVGLDSEVSKLPKHLQGKPDAALTFNKAIIDATKDYCVGYKINTAFYESEGVKGWETMQETLEYIPKNLFTIADAKRGDIGNTSAQYARTFFETMQFDAVTVAPYMGEDSVRPFLEYQNKWTIVLGLTSNAGSQDFEQQTLANSGKQLYEVVLEKVASWGTPNNLMFVVGATKASDFEGIRNIIPNHFLLVPGVGAQGGNLQDVCKYGLNKDCGLLINSSRGIIYASNGTDFAQKAREEALKLQQEMKQILG